MTPLTLSWPTKATPFGDNLVALFGALRAWNYSADKRLLDEAFWAGDHVAGGKDYPHTDGIWPESSKYIEEQFSRPTRL